MTRIGPRTMCLYGQTGDTKTSQCYHIARYYHRKTGCPAKNIRECPGPPECKGKRIRVINTDPGQSFEAFLSSGMVEKGIVDYRDISSVDRPLATVNKLALGYWPKDPNWPIEGDLVASDEYMTTPEEWGIWGCYIIEGITSMTDLWLSYMKHMATGPGKGGGVAFQSSYYYEEDGCVFSGLQEGHYQLPQGHIRDVHTLGFRLLPIDLLIWTALVGKGLDKLKGEDCFAPKGAGQADNFKIPGWFGDCIHLGRKEFRGADGATTERVVAWFTQHLDNEGVKYLAKARLAPESYPELLRRFPGGYVPMDYKNGMVRYMLAMDEIRGGK